ncbi:MAG: SPOR domain-containing protein [Spirosomaceae bacterium]|jgi:cell division septation protein DedD|nr:SPOR domain-containing protein [Spirosomataceae bacterium]
MISVLDYTRKLLYEHDCVVIPELGGFIAYFNHAFYSNQNALYHAPQKRVAFNEALRLDDGLLVHYLTVNEQLAREEAQKRVRQFVEDIKTGVQTQGEYLLEGIGTLSRNAEGKLQFEPTPTTNFYQDGFGLTSVAVAALDTQPTVEESDSTADWTLTNREAEAWEITTPHRRRSRRALYVGGVLVLGIAAVAGFTQLPAESVKSSLNPFELIETAKTIFVADKKDNAVQVAAKQVFVPIAQPKATDAPKMETVTNTAPTSIKEPSVAKELVQSKVEKNTEIESENTAFSSDQDQVYFVMAGGFSQLSNAEKLVKKLKRNRYPDAHIVNPTPEEGKLILVAAVGYDTPQEAKQHLGRVGKLSGANAWVLHH